MKNGLLKEASNISKGGRANLRAVFEQGPGSIRELAV